MYVHFFQKNKFTGTLTHNARTIIYKYTQVLSRALEEATNEDVKDVCARAVERLTDVSILYVLHMRVCIQILCVYVQHNVYNIYK